MSAPIPARGIAAFAPTAPLGRWEFARRPVGPRDVRVAIDYCGICHSDVHTVRGEWGPITYPLVPGHEIVGRVAEVGSAVTRWQVGDRVGVGCMVASCRQCGPCGQGLEQYCDAGFTDTYNGKDLVSGGVTQGGYSDTIVVDDHFVLRVPEGLDAAAAAPLLCAGITTWSPLTHWGTGPGKRVGVVGIGGLGHMAVKLASALGAEVVAITRSAAKAAEARRLGAHDAVVATEAGALKAHRTSLDLIIDTVGTGHDLEPLVGLLRMHGTLCLVGGAPEPHSAVRAFSLIGKRRSIAGSLIGGIAETQAMLDFCGARGIASDVELVGVDGINAAYERVVHADVRYRFVIDLATLDGGR
jgi:uncharacterized zinc-type alcohol dehydrogenase-like protein